MSLRALLLGIVLLALGLSAIEPYDRFTWWLEVAPVLIALPILVATARRFPLTSLAYVLIAAHAIVLVVGGHWTYARVPLGFRVQEWFDLARNPYDRFGHFMQGFVPAILAREVLSRTSPLRGSRWLAPTTVAWCLAISAAYELVEWQAAVWTGSAAEAFLGTQGDPWDTQWDMCLALVGAVLALVLLSRVHDRQLARLAPAGRDRSRPR